MTKKVSSSGNLINLPNQQEGAQSVYRTLLILEAFTKHGPEIGLSNLARLVGLNKTTTYRILKALESRGYVSRIPDDRSFRLGVRVFELGAYYLRQLDIRRIGLPYLQKLSERMDETTFLCIREGNEALCIERVEAQKNIGNFALNVGGRQPLHCGGASRALLLGMSDADVENYVTETSLQPMTPHTITTLEQLKKDILATKKQGYVISSEDVTIGIVSIGVPIWDYSNNVVAAISVSGIAQSLRQRQNELKDEIMETASVISMQMGYAG